MDLLWCISVLALTILESALVLGQVQTKGRLSPLGHQKSGNLNDVIHIGPKLDNEALLKATLEREQPDPLTHMRPQAPHKFAEAVDVTIDIANSTHGKWIEDASNSRRIWRTVIKSPGALSISLLFSEFQLPDDSELYIIGKNDTLGAFTAEVNNKSSRKFASTPLAGDSVIVEFHQSTDLKTGIPQPPALRIGKVIHGFRSTPFAYGSSGHCHVDVECKKNSKNTDQINSTIVIITDEGTSFCTGTMINNARQDGTQYVLTANHCIFADPSYFIIGFNYQHPSCYRNHREASPMPPRPKTAHGVSLVTRWEASDYALLKVAERIPTEYNAYLSGWDSTFRAPSSVFSVHHPQGDVKKISTFHGQTVLAPWSDWDRAKMHWMIPRWSEGSTERGSSGAGLFNSNGLLVGHLRGGSASCDNSDGWDKFGALFADFMYPSDHNKLGKYLDPENTGTKVLPGVYLKSIPRQNMRMKKPRRFSTNRNSRSRRNSRPRRDEKNVSINPHESVLSR